MLSFSYWSSGSYPGAPFPTSHLTPHSFVPFSPLSLGFSPLGYAQCEEVLVLLFFTIGSPRVSFFFGLVLEFPALPPPSVRLCTPLRQAALCVASHSGFFFFRLGTAGRSPFLRPRVAADGPAFFFFFVMCPFSYLGAAKMHGVVLFAFS